MGLLTKWRQRRAQRAIEKATQSTDWRVAERAIGQLPGTLPVQRALAILLPLSAGYSNTAVSIAGWAADRGQISLTQEAMTGRHIRSSIAALGRVSAPEATQRLLDILVEMSGFAKEVVKALGTPAHSRCALDLEARAKTWPRELQSVATNALWHMGTEEAFEAFLRLDRLMHGGKRLFPDEQTRAAWKNKH